MTPAERTKIIATYGPALEGEIHGSGRRATTSRSPGPLDRIVQAGVDYLRLNLAHGSNDQIVELLRKLDELRSSRDSPGILVDLPGPRIRLLPPDAGADSLALRQEVRTGDILDLDFGFPGEGFAEAGAIRVQVDNEPFADAVRSVNGFADIGEALRAESLGRLLLGDGLVSLRPLTEQRGVVSCQVEGGGEVRRGWGVYFAGARLALPGFTVRDRELLNLVLEVSEQPISYLAVSALWDESGVLAVAEALAADLGPSSRPRLLAKIETEEGWAASDRILEAADGLIIARGDISIFSEVGVAPRIQKLLIDRCRQLAKDAFVATQVLESMVEALRPTRHEESDLFNAVLDGCHGIVLSAETAVGRHPLRAIENARQVVNEAEAYRRRTAAAATATAPPEVESLEGVRCFISYSTRDSDFAERLYSDLVASGIRCWFAEHHMRGGRKLHDQVHQAIGEADRVLLILSESSIASQWVLSEIASARSRESQERKQLLFPIRLVNMEAIRNWRAFDADEGTDTAKAIREYFIPDFSLWRNDPEGYRRQLERLVRDLRLS